MTKVILLLFVSLSCFAQDDDLVVKFNPSGNLSIGRSIDVNNPGSGKQEAITYNKIIWPDGGSVFTSLKASLATSIDELYQKLNLDFNTQGEVKLPVVGGGKAEFDLKYEVEHNYTDNNLYYVIQAYNDFGRQVLDGISIKSEFKRLLDDKKYDQFIRAAGTHFVERQRRASTIYAVITISKLNTMTKKSLNLTYKTSMNLNINKVVELTAQQTLQFKNFIKTASQLASVKIDYYSSGTEGLSKLANIFPQSPDDLSIILKAISDATATATKDNSTPIEYQLTSFHAYGLNVPTFDKNKSECLSKYINKKIIINSYLTKLRQIAVDYVGSTFNTYYLGKIDKLTTILNSIERLEKECKENGNCCQQDIKIEPITWLEDMVIIQNTRVVPDYVDVYNASGSKVGRLIKSIKLVVEGDIQNDEHYCCMGGYYLNDNLDPVKIDLKFIGNTNPSVSDAERDGDFSKRQFVYIIDMANIDYESNANGSVVYNNTNLDRSQSVVDRLRRNNYFIESASRDYLKYYVDVRAFDFTNIRTFIPH